MDQRDKRSKAHRDAGTELAIESAYKLGKPFLVVDIKEIVSATEITNWISSNKIAVLNVSGPCERNCIGIYVRVYNLMMEMLAVTEDEQRSSFVNCR